MAGDAPLTTDPTTTSEDRADSPTGDSTISAGDEGAEHTGGDHVAGGPTMRSHGPHAPATAQQLPGPQVNRFEAVATRTYDRDGCLTRYLQSALNSDARLTRRLERLWWETRLGSVQIAVLLSERQWPEIDRIDVDQALQEHRIRARAPEKAAHLYKSKIADTNDTRLDPGRAILNEEDGADARGGVSPFRFPCCVDSLPYPEPLDALRERFAMSIAHTCVQALLLLLHLQPLAYYQHRVYGITSTSRETQSRDRTGTLARNPLPCSSSFSRPSPPSRAEVCE